MLRDGRDLQATEEQLLLSMPAAVSGTFHTVEPQRLPGAFVASDPPGTQLGSAGGTAYILTEAWAQTSEGQSFDAWLGATRKLLVHGSGQSRRLPCYAAAGKPLIPVPHLRGFGAQRPDQALLDLQVQAYRRLYRHAPPAYRVLLACGDVLLDFQHWLPAYPEADVLIVGLTASPEEAHHHGVMFCPHDAPTELDTFLQKPDPATVRGLTGTHTFFLDTGVWLLNERALAVLMEKCGWDAEAQCYPAGAPTYYELYAAFGPALGRTPTEPDPPVNALRSAVLPLPDARFYHFGTCRSLLASVAELQSPAYKQRSFGHASFEMPAPPVVQNADVRCTLGNARKHIWIENSVVPPGWALTQRHVLTGIPPNDWQLALPAGVCIDCAPVAGGTCVRCYGFEDPMRGPVGANATLWLGRPAPDWFQARDINPAAAGIADDTDIHDAPLFPVLDPDDTPPDFVEWLVADAPSPDETLRDRWLGSDRLSARDLLSRANIEALAQSRRQRMRDTWATWDDTAWLESIAHLDLAGTARLHVREKWPLRELDPAEHPASLGLMHERMLRAVIAAQGGPADPNIENEAFAQLRRLMVDEMELQPVRPHRNVLEDQIVWGRCPIRLDLAGGWTDTPPYCMEHGGHVVNVAADLNGQPPVQVFGRISEKPEIVLRSVDLGIDQRIRAYDDLVRYDQIGSGFAIARAALALAGLAPRFHAGRRYASLAEQLQAEFGGGIELSMVCAIPKGSGLGTSSVLAATVLGTLSELCGLEWSQVDLFRRTSALEQMLTSGGGWQDQIGGVVRGLKLIETEAGLAQIPVIRELPLSLLQQGAADTRVLLYYTGLTRVAHDILGEIVRGLFLNAAEHVGLIEEIGSNALFGADAIQRNDWPGLCEAVRRSWRLNQLLDRGTNPPAVRAILDPIHDLLAACKLLGAGGGGYLLMLAKDDDAGRRIHRTLTEHPPNDRARFVDLSVSDVGFQVTRS